VGRLRKHVPGRVHLAITPPTQPRHIGYALCALRYLLPGASLGVIHSCYGSPTRALTGMSSTTLSVGKGAPRVQNDTAQRAFVRARLLPMLPERRGSRSSARVIAVRLLTLLRSDPQARAIGRLIAAVSTGDQCIVLTGDDPARREVLDRIAHELASLRCRVVRVAANEADEFSLQDFVQQLSGQLGSDGGTEDTLERVHRYLTEVDAGCDRIVLLIDHAHRLQSPGLRFLQLTCRSSPNLRVVLASKSGDTAIPCATEFRLLQARSEICISLGVSARTRDASTSALTSG